MFKKIILFTWSLTKMISVFQSCFVFLLLMPPQSGRIVTLETEFSLLQRPQGSVVQGLALGPRGFWLLRWFQFPTFPHGPVCDLKFCGFFNTTKAKLWKRVGNEPHSPLRKASIALWNDGLGGGTGGNRTLSPILLLTLSIFLNPPRLDSLVYKVRGCS